MSTPPRSAPASGPTAGVEQVARCTLLMTQQVEELYDLVSVSYETRAL